MEQLELTAQIIQVDNLEYPYELFVSIDEKLEYSSWHRGKTVNEIMNKFYKSLVDSNIKYWYLLKDI